MTILSGSISGTQSTQLSNFAAGLGGITLPRTELAAFADGLDFGTLEEVSLTASLYELDVFKPGHQFVGKIIYSGSGFITSGWDGNPATLTAGTIGIGTIINSFRLVDPAGRDLLVYGGSINSLQIVSDSTNAGSFGMTQLQLGSAAVGAMVKLTGNLTIGVATAGSTTGALSGSINEFTFYARRGTEAYQITVAGNLTPTASFLETASGDIVKTASSLAGEINAVTFTRIGYVDATSPTETGQTTLLSASELHLDSNDLGALLVAAGSPYGPDNGFGTGGHVTTALSTGNDVASAIALQADGRIVVAGNTAPDSTNFSLAVARYNADGTPDTSFDGDGRYILPGITGTSAQVHDIVIRGDGSILVSGAVFSAGTGSRDVLMRFASNGSPDNSFSGDGLQVVNAASFARAMVLQGSGNSERILVAHDNFSLTRFNSDGSVDTGFGNAGTVSPGIFGTVADMQLQADGKIVVFGTTTQNPGFGTTFVNYTLVRFNTDGSLDTSFDFDGQTSITIAPTGNSASLTTLARSLLVLPDGRLFVTGSSLVSGAQPTTNVVAAVFAANGSLSAPFFVRSVNLDREDIGLAATYDPSSGLVLVDARGDSTAAVLRFNPNTGLDSKTLSNVPSIGSSGGMVRGPGGELYLVANDSLAASGRDWVLGKLIDSEASLKQILLGGNDQISLSNENGVNIDGYSGNDSINGGAGPDTLTGGLGNDAINGGAGHDILSYTASGGAVSVSFTGPAAGSASDGSGGTDSFSNIEEIRGSGLADTLTGAAGNQVFAGNGGNDSINGGAGIDIAVFRGNRGAYSITSTGANSFTVSGPDGSDSLTNIEILRFADQSLALVNGASYTYSQVANGSILQFDPANDVLNVDGGVSAFNLRVRAATSGPFAGREIVLEQLDGELTVIKTIHLVFSASADVTNPYKFSATNIMFADGSVLQVGDTLTGTGADDSTTTPLTGGNGADRLISYGGGQIIDGGAGNDVLISIGGGNGASGGSGSDVFIGGSGVDILSLGAVAGLTGYSVNLLAGTGSVAGSNPSTFTVSGIENVIGSAAADSLTGGFISGLVVGKRSDPFQTFEGAGGNDTINGGSANVDEFVTASYARSPGAVHVNLGAGTAADGWGGNDTLTNIDGVVGSAFNDILTGGGGGTQIFAATGLFESFEGGRGDDTIDGGIGNDRVSYQNASGAVSVNLATHSASGADGNDTLFNIEQIRGSAFADTLTGDVDNNQFEGLGGNDTINGGAGFDSLRYSRSTSGVTVFFNGPGSGTAFDGLGGIDSFANIEEIWGSDQADFLTGSFGNETFVGNAGDDTINGGSGFDRVSYNNSRNNSGVSVDLLAGTAIDSWGDTDRLVNIDAATGSVFNDMLTGDNFNNSLNGNFGNDTLIGGLGNDNLFGDGGSDIAVYAGNQADFTVTPLGNKSYSVIDNNLADGNEGSDTLFGIETLRFGGINGVQTQTLSTGTFFTWSFLANGTILQFDPAIDVLNVDAAGVSAFNLRVRAETSGPLAGRAMVLEQIDSEVTAIKTIRLVFTASADATNPYKLAAGNLVFADGSKLLAGDTQTGTAGDDGSTVPLAGGNGNDRLISYGGSQTVDGGAGNDVLITIGGANGTAGGSGSDAFVGGSGSDTLVLGAVAGLTGYSVNLPAGTGAIAGSNPSTFTLSGIESVIGSAAADTLTGGFAAGLYVGLRSDPFQSFEGQGGNDSINGGSANVDETVGASYAHSPSAVNVNLGTGIASDGWGGTDTLSNIDAVTGSAFNDLLIGGSGSTQGFAATNLFEFFEGGLGDDTIDGGIGGDRVSYEHAAGSVTVNLALGTATGADGNDTLISIENARGSAFNDSLTGDANNNQLQGMAGNDTMDGAGGYDNLTYQRSTAGVSVTFTGVGSGTASDGFGGTDTFSNIEEIQGSDQADTLTGGAGNETFIGNAGNDIIDGGSGFDTLSYNSMRIALSVGGAGVTVNLGNGSAQDPWGNTDTFFNIDAVTGTLFNDTLTGDNFNNNLNGGFGNDTLTGGLGNDTLNGSGGTDTAVYAGNLADFIVTPLGTKSYRVVDNNQADGNEGTDTLFGIETLRFGGSNGVQTQALGSGTFYSFSFLANGTILQFDPAIDVLNVDAGVAAGNLRVRAETSGPLAGRAMVLEQLDAEVSVIKTIRLAFTASADATNPYKLAATNLVFADGSKLLAGDTLTGTAGDDSTATTLTGGAFGDRLISYGGSQTLDGGAGDDVLITSGGANGAAGGSGNDAFIGGSGTDVLVLGAVAGLTGYSVNLLAGTGAIVGSNPSSFTLSGIEGVLGSAAADTLTGGFAAGQYLGLRSDPLQTFEGSGGNDSINGGSSNVDETVIASYAHSPGAVNVNLGTGIAADGWGGTDTLTNIDGVTGSAFNDLLTGGSGSTLTFAATNLFEVFEGGLGDDTIDGGIGGDRTSYEHAAGSVVVNLALGTASGADGNDTLISIENVRGSAFNDTLTGDADNNQLQGMAGNDTIDGADGNDLLAYTFSPLAVNVSFTGVGSGTASDGFGGVDTFTGIEQVAGSDQADTLTGGAGNETFIGCAGDDTIDGGSGFDRISYVNSRNNTGVTVNLLAGTAIDSWGNTDHLFNIDAVTGSVFNDSLTGDTFNNSLNGNFGNDTLIGGLGNDTLSGDGGSDTAVYAGNQADFTVTPLGNKSYSVVDNNLADGNEGSDTLFGIETLRFGGLNGVQTQALSTGTVFTYSFLGNGTILQFDPSIDVLNVDAGVSAFSLRVRAETSGPLAGRAMVLEQLDLEFSVIKTLRLAFTASADATNPYKLSASNIVFADSSKLLVGDTLTATAGDDSSGTTLTGGAGSDRLISYGGSQTLDGGAGDDVLITSGGANGVAGASGSDVFIGGSGTDVLVLGAVAGLAGYNVNLLAGSGAITGSNPSTFTVAGIERVIGSAAADTLTGGFVPGQVLGLRSDPFQSFEGDGGNDSIDGGSSNLDEFVIASYARSPGAVNVNLGNGTASDGWGGTDTLSNIDAVIGSAFNDVLTGGSGSTQILAGTGLFESFEGGLGNDTIDGGIGNDRVSYQNASGAVTVNLATHSASGADGSDTLLNIEQIRGSAFGDTLTGDADNNQFEGLAGNDTIDGGGGFDSLRYSRSTGAVTVTFNNFGAGTASDGFGNTDSFSNIEEIWGSDQADTLTGSFGNETFVGNSGDDSIDGGSGFDRVSYGNSRNYSGVSVNLLAAIATDSWGSTDHLFNIDAVTGSLFNDNLTGDNFNNSLDGNSGDDSLRGGLGNDTINGGAGFDTASFSGNRSLYTFVRRFGAFDVIGPDGTDRLVNIETLKFADTSSLLMSLDSDAGIIDNFSATRYLASNRDLLGYFGPNLDAAIVHFFNAGFSEGRRTTAFDAFRYLASNTDLLASLGPDGEAAALQFVQSGFASGRPSTSFDAFRYLASNTDLLGYFGPDAQAATEHFVRAGFGEQRPTIGFDGFRYLASNTDLLNFFGPDAQAATEHFVRAGYGEHRPSAGFDGFRYLASNTDLLNFFGPDTQAATEHFVRAGYGEHRPSAGFDGFRYLASNTDLLNFFGADAQAATEHFVRAGYGEHRPTTGFDGFRYLASNTDLIASLGADSGAAARHFVQSGYAAGRPTVSFDPFRYLASNLDLLDYFGPNAQAAAATEHFVRAGFAESRPAAAFDPAQYLANYVDLAATFGNDLAAATLQFVRSGHGEGRTDLRLLFQGSGGADTLTGNAAANTLAGGLGNDTLTGGAGADLFVFNTPPDAASNRDTISDFTPGTDKLVLDHLVFASLGIGLLPADRLVSGVNPLAADGNDYLLYDPGSGAVSYDADGNGGGAAVRFATLTSNPTITAADFAII